MALRIDKYDTGKFTEGEWEQIDGGWFKIARMNNPTYRNVKRRLDKEYRRKHGEELDAETEDEKEAYLVAEGLLRDWSDITALDNDDNEVQVPYSVENVARLLLGRPDVLPKIAQKSVELDRFEREEVEDQAKKPAASSSGKPSGGKAEA